MKLKKMQAFIDEYIFVGLFKHVGETVKVNDIYYLITEDNGKTRPDLIKDIKLWEVINRLDNCEYLRNKEGKSIKLTETEICKIMEELGAWDK